jgi:hypothetical protein
VDVEEGFGGAVDRAPAGVVGAAGAGCPRHPGLSGIAVTNLRVAVTQRVQQDGQWRDGDTSFFKVNV